MIELTHENVSIYVQTLFALERDAVAQNNEAARDFIRSYLVNVCSDRDLRFNGFTAGPHSRLIHEDDKLRGLPGWRTVQVPDPVMPEQAAADMRRKLDANGVRNVAELINKERAAVTLKQNETLKW